MGFFVRDLHKQITEMYKQQSNQQKPMTIYRGQVVSSDEFDKLRKSKGGLISFNYFLSTSTNIDISKQFARSSPENKLNPVLFEIYIDPKISSVPFASIDSISVFEGENEILFSMHTIFRIVKVQDIQDEYLLVNLHLTDENDPALMKLTDHFRKEIGDGDSLE
ncbi:unnamed protein product [Rotaria sordida]|uniref:NAD(P)(+)--arginine ADP-ribosyltransferase n=1 Tax=Rotaria sordida TaxID=392033 RepID=A0A813YXQ2_9BILA|nr:unnamed protein product [Rotaria sordida]CAF4100474.1 unnamed protein product [Rotaria sordida]